MVESSHWIRDLLNSMTHIMIGSFNVFANIELNKNAGCSILYFDLIMPYKYYTTFDGSRVTNASEYHNSTQKRSSNYSIPDFGHNLVVATHVLSGLL